MHHDRQILDDEVECAHCGELVSPRFGTCYALGERAFLCFECSVQRGGRLSAGLGWMVRPDTSGLAAPASTRGERPPA
ncbi:MAG TPA: hypothetical protein VKY73_04300 [Polyangiaceae bacterium]|nr:hypothetical protein [Polyangiaceae bacterium]